jgi:hypothetical protein
MSQGPKAGGLNVKAPSDLSPGTELFPTGVLNVVIGIFSCINLYSILYSSHTNSPPAPSLPFLASPPGLKLVGARWRGPDRHPLHGQQTTTFLLPSCCPPQECAANGSWVRVVFEEIGNIEALSLSCTLVALHRRLLLRYHAGVASLPSKSRRTRDRRRREA